MNSADFVDTLVEQMKSGGIPLSEECWRVALACVGWAYVYGAWGAECTPAERRKRLGYNPDHTTIKTACQVLSGKKGSCDGCKWYPDGHRTRCFDCRGFVDWVLKEVAGFDLYGDTVSTQWSHADNWCAKGQIGKDPIPKGVLVNVFICKDGKWTHTGFYKDGATVECSSGVQYFEKMKAGRWTHWAVAKCFKDEMEVDDMTRPGYAEVTGKRVALRQEPSKSAKIITRIDTGKEVKLEPEPEKVWDYVSYQGKFGWMMREFLREG